MPLSARKELVLTELAGTTEGFLTALEGVDEATWRHKPAPERWSVAEIAEHTTVVLQSIAKLLTRKLLSLPLPPRESAPRISDDQIVRLMFDRSKRRDAPAPMNPTGRFADLAATVAAFTQARDQLDAFVRGTEADLRAYGAPHPILGTLDGVQWLLFAAAHTERHTRQLQEARATVLP
jgi:hypothetical protein